MFRFYYLHISWKKFALYPECLRVLPIMLCALPRMLYICWTSDPPSLFRSVMIFTAHDNCKYLQLSVLFQKKKHDKTFRENRVIIIDIQEIIFTTALNGCKYRLDSIQLSERKWTKTRFQWLVMKTRIQGNPYTNTRKISQMILYI